MPQSSTRKSRKISRIAGFTPLLLAGVLLTACSGGTSDEAAGSDVGQGDASPTSPADRALAYSKCMRENGVEEFPDPGEGGGIKLGPESGIDMKSPEFKKAQEACKDLSPQGQGSGGGTLDPAKVAEWADCIRENGVPEFADPEINGNSMEVDLTGIDPESESFKKAQEACRDKRPQGGVIMKGGGAR